MSEFDAAPLESPLATKILHELAKQPSYTSELSKRLDKHQTSVDRVVQKLEKVKFIEPILGENPTYYRVNTERIADFMYQELKHEANSEVVIESLIDNEEWAREFLESYINHILPQNCGYWKLEKVLFEGLEIILNSQKLEDNLELNSPADWLLSALRWRRHKALDDTVYGALFNMKWDKQKYDYGGIKDFTKDEAHDYKKVEKTPPVKNIVKQALPNSDEDTGFTPGELADEVEEKGVTVKMVETALSELGREGEVFQNENGSYQRI